MHDDAAPEAPPSSPNVGRRAAPDASEIRKRFRWFRGPANFPTIRKAGSTESRTSHSPSVRTKIYAGLCRRRRIAELIAVQNAVAAKSGTGVDVEKAGRVAGEPVRGVEAYARAVVVSKQEAVAFFVAIDDAVTAETADAGDHIIGAIVIAAQSAALMKTKVQTIGVETQVVPVAILGASYNSIATTLLVADAVAAHALAAGKASNAAVVIVG